MTKKELEAKVERLEAQIRELTGKSSEGTLHVSMLQDKSGSMQGREQDVINGFNEYIGELKSEDADIRFTLTQFDTTYRTLYESARLSSVRRLTSLDYQPSGMTALYDALGNTIQLVEREMRMGDRALIVVMTDGYENSSREHKQHTISDLVDKRQRQGNWTFVYLGADIDAFTGGTGIGIHAGNTLRFDKGNHAAMYRNLSSATVGYAASAQAATQDFAEDFMTPTSKGNDEKTGSS